MGEIIHTQRRDCLSVGLRCGMTSQGSKNMRTNILLMAAALTLVMLAAGCLGSPAASVEDAADDAPVANFEPLSLVRDPESMSVAPLPRPEAERVFRWPGDERPSLIFVYDDGAT